MHVFTRLEELEQAVGTHLGFSDWTEVTQEQVQLFADATGDHQWIHLDQERAAAGPFGRTIAHGYLTLALVPLLGSQVYRVDGLSMGINYGSDKVRFPAVVPVGSRVRGGVELLSLKPVSMGSQLATRVTVEVEGSDKPACVAETLACSVP